MIKELLLVGCGGFLGACGRFLAGKMCGLLWHNAFPLGTFAVNVAGCLLIGVFMGLSERSRALTPEENLLLVTGLCGGFTTFSTFANDMWVLADRGNWGVLALYLGGSVALGVLMVCLGRALVRCI
ncbi:MAG: fluoride efflux transporter CrcB [Muribaculaceae bacterium]|nr:fluoride efflux transporter CrcB [Muribaculaceae bacterium]